MRLTPSLQTYFNSSAERNAKLQARKNSITSSWYTYCIFFIITKIEV